MWIPLGTNAPKLCPADPVKVMSIVPSGNPAPFHTLVTSWPSRVPVVRLMLRIADSILTEVASVIAPWRIDRQVAPADHRQPGLGRKFEINDGPIQRVGYLEQDPGATVIGVTVIGVTVIGHILDG